MKGVEVILKDGTREWIDPVVSIEEKAGVMYIDNGHYVYEYSDPEIKRLKNLLRDMAEYTEHDCTCPMSQWRMGEPTDEPGYDGYKTLFGYGKAEKWYGRNEYPPCNCGLREIIDRFKEAIGDE